VKSIPVPQHEKNLYCVGDPDSHVFERTEVKERAVEVEQVFQPPLHPHPGLSIFLVIPDVFCALSAILATEKSGMPNVQIAIGLKEKNSRSSEKEIQRNRILILLTEGIPHVVHIMFIIQLYCDNDKDHLIVMKCRSLVCLDTVIVC
jgi:hypothetical protein